MPCGENECELYCNICLEDEEKGDITKRVMICTAASKEAQDIKSNAKAEIISQNEDIIVAKVPKSMAEIVGSVLKVKKNK